MHPFYIPQCSITEQKFAHFCSEWSTVEYGTGVFWDLWVRSINQSITSSWPWVQRALQLQAFYDVATRTLVGPYINIRFSNVDHQHRPNEDDMDGVILSITNQHGEKCLFPSHCMRISPIRSFLFNRFPFLFFSLLWVRPVIIIIIIMCITHIDTMHVRVYQGNPVKSPGCVLVDRNTICY